MEPVERRAETWFSAIVCVTYVLCGQIVSNVYPFSSFGMYARVAPTATRMIARSSAGTVSEVAEYTNWKCSAFRVTDCLQPGDTYVVYRDREAFRVLRDATALKSVQQHHPEPVLLLRRIWRFAPVVESHDCVIAHCTAVRR